MAGKTARRSALVLGLLLVGVAMLGTAYPLWWNARSSAVGGALLTRAVRQAAVAKSTRGCPNQLAAAAAATSSSPAVLVVPAIGLVAPVLNGIGDNVLNTAVGHVPGTPWPGTSGESMLEAHDVSYFTNLSHLRSGDTVVFETDCLRSTYRVVTTSVSAPGNLVSPPSNGTGLALVTCWPTNALFWTSRRFLVQTRFVSEVPARQNLPSTGPPAKAISVPMPSALVESGLTLETNSLPMGVLNVAGTPAKSWIQGPAPLSTEAAALEDFFGAEKAVRAHNATWWQVIAPGLPLPGSWPGFPVGNVTITVNGSVPSSVTISSGSSHVVVTVHNDVMHVSSIA